MNKFPTKLLGPEFKSDNKIRSKALKFIVKKIINNNGNVLPQL